MKDFKKYYTLPAPPDEVYIALTNPFTIRLWTDEEAVMSTEPGSEFSMMDGSITGRNLEFEPDKKIVQQWDFDEDAPASVVTLKLFPKGAGTSVQLIHTNIPDDAYDDITDGWDHAYFANLKAFFDED